MEETLASALMLSTRADGHGADLTIGDCQPRGIDAAGGFEFTDPAARALDQAAISIDLDVNYLRLTGAVGALKMEQASACV